VNRAGRWHGYGSTATPVQQRTIAAAACLTLLHGRTPTLSELGEALGCSKQAAHCRLRWLEKKGLWRGENRQLTESGLRSMLEPVAH
jgi:predicted transcriptional regulator